MTGEITITGRILAIGGLKEKSLAAYRMGIQTVLIPEANVADIEYVPQEVREKIKFIPVESIVPETQIKLGVLWGKLKNTG